MAVNFIPFVNTTGATCGAGTDYPSASFMCMFYISLSVLYSFGQCVVCPSSIYGF